MIRIPYLGRKAFLVILSNATLEKGEQLIKAAVKGLEEVLRAYRSGKLRDGWGWSEEKMVGRKEGQLITF